MGPVRIAHVTDCYLPRVGGIERQVHGLALAQRELGHDVSIITSVPGTDPASSATGIVVHRPERTGSASVQNTGAIRYRSTWAGSVAAAACDADVVHLHCSTFSPLAYLTARRTAGHVPTAVTLHSLWAYATPIFRGADAVLGWRSWPLAWSAVSSVAAAQLSAVLDRTPVSVLANAVEPQRWQLPPNSPDPNRVVVATTMRLASRKRPLELLRIMRAVRGLVPASVRIELEIIGDGPLAPKMRRYLARHGMTDWVRLCGQLDAAQIRRHYAGADLYVAPATLESFGIAALEARSAGLPVIAFASTGVADFVTDGVHGRLVDDDDAMAAAIARLITRPELRARLAAHNTRTSPDQTWPSVTLAAQALYTRAAELIGRHPAELGAGGPAEPAYLN